MRTYKFRGRQIDGEWIYGSLVQYEDGSASICVDTDEEGFGRYYMVDPETVGQFVGTFGMSQKVDLYEGDHVLMKSGAWFDSSTIGLGGSTTYEFETEGVVEWSAPTFCVKDSQGVKHMLLLDAEYKIFTDVPEKETKT